MPAQLHTTTPSDFIHVRYADGDGTRTLQSSDSVRIGRDLSCDLRLDGLTVEDRHAEIYRVGDLWWVRDLGSSDGIYLDDEFIEAAPLVGLSALRLGEGGPKLWLQPGEADGCELAREEASQPPPSRASSAANATAGSGVPSQASQKPVSGVCSRCMRVATSPSATVPSGFQASPRAA